MRTLQNTILLLAFTFLGMYVASAQELLTKENAILMTLENNYDIKLTKNSLETAKNNASLYNSGYLPTLFTRAAGSFDNTDTEFTLINDQTNKISGIETINYNASIGVNYVLFNVFVCVFTAVF